MPTYSALIQTILDLLKVFNHCRKTIWTTIRKYSYWDKVMNENQQIIQIWSNEYLYRKCYEYIRGGMYYIYSIFNWIFGGIWTVMLTRIALFFPNGPKLTTWKLQQATFKFSGGLRIFTIITITTFQFALWRAIYQIRSRTTDMV